jgi:hypothetical protein
MVSARAQADDYNPAKRRVDRVESINASHEKAGPWFLRWP